MKPSMPAFYSPENFLFKTYFLLLFFFATPLIAQQLPEGFKSLQIATGLLKPTSMAFAPDGRIFVTEQSGAVRIIKNGVLLPNPFIKLSVSLRGEGGLLGIAFDPDFQINQNLYLYYTLSNQSRNRISQFKANGDIVVAGSEKIIWVSDTLTSTVHLGGSMRFKDGKLFAATGDSYTVTNAQDLNSSHGKVIRINKDGSIPSGNPFTTGSIQKKKIWAYGLRNPFTFDVDPATGKIFVNDVGLNDWEEINDATLAGKNFGWPDTEGIGTNPTFANPVYAYNHGANDEVGCAITGGAFFNPLQTNYPASYRGKYFFQDYCTQWIKTLSFSESTSVVQNFAAGLGIGTINLSVGNDGNLYYILRSTGSLHKIIYTTNEAPAVIKHPSPVTVSQGQVATFTVTVTGKTPLTYQWQKNNIDISGATLETYKIDNTTINHAGDYRVKVSNVAGNVISNSAKLTITAFNTNPVATIISPSSKTLYRGGEIISFSGSATDQEDGQLAASQFVWLVDFYHDTHDHSGPPFAAGVKSGSFTVPTRGETSDSVFYRISLTVTDSKGLKDTTYTDVFPRKSIVRMATQPVGLQVKIDGRAVVTPFAFTGVELMERAISSVSPQTFNGKTYQFEKWLHGGTDTQTISTPLKDSTFTAIYKEVTLMPPSYPTNVVNGLDYKYYEARWAMLPDFKMLTPVKKGTVTNFSLVPQLRPDQFGFQFTGYVEVPNDGYYIFYTSSDDGSKLYIGTTQVVNNDGKHSSLEKSGKIGLKKGKHLIRVDYFEDTGSSTLQVRYEGPGVIKKLIPSTSLYRQNTTTTTTQQITTQAISDSQKFSFHPNPARNVVNVEISSITGEAILIRITNDSQNIVLQKSHVGVDGINKITIDTRGLQSGIYYLECKTALQTNTGRLVIE